MKEQFADDYFFIRDVIHYLRNGNNSQKKEYAEKLRSRYEEFIRAVIGKKIIIEYELKEDAFNEFCQHLFESKYLEKYRGDSSFKTYIYKEILGAIRVVMPESEEAKAEKRKEKNEREREKRTQKRKDIDNASNKDQTIYEELTAQQQEDKTKAKKYTEDDTKQYLHSSSSERILQQDLEEATFTRQDNQEHLLGAKDLRAKLDQAIAISVLKMSQIHPKDIRIFVMNLCDYDWDKIAEIMDMEVGAAKKRYIRRGGILEKFSELLIKTLWDNYKINFQTISGNLNDIMDIE